MDLEKSKMPTTKNTVVSKVLAKILSDAESALRGEDVSLEAGFFGENSELPAYALILSEGGEAGSLTQAKAVDALLQRIYRDEASEVSESSMIACLTLGFYGLVFAKYDDEDFRYLYRYATRAIRKYNVVEEWLKKALVFESLLHHIDPEGIFSRVLIWLKYLGAPIFNPMVLAATCQEFEVDAEKYIEQPEIKLIDTIRRHSEYLEEALGNRSYHETRNATKDWLPDALSSELLSIYRKSANDEAQNKIREDMSPKDAFKQVNEVFKKTGFQSNSESVLPVRLQDLQSPPNPPAVDPIVFELIPKKLRMDLLPAVAYSTKTKRIEVIFLGGPRIGQSGILIKTDTGGILMDFGLSVANHRIPEWVPELEMIDSVLVSHSHLDHIGGLPVLYEKYTGKWCSVGFTGAITKALLQDAIKVGTPHPPRKKDRWDLISRFNQDNVDKVSKNHVKLELGKSSEVGPGILVTPIDASHIPGSVSYLVDIEGVKILYTGDFNMDKSVLFPGANLPTDPDMIIFDGTYWGRVDFDRQKVSETISDVIQTSGPVIIPSFAVGRSQEILVTLDNLGITKQRNVMVAGLAEHITKLVGISGSWQGMKKNKVTLDKEDVLVAGGGMMGGGLARQHFKEHRKDPEAAVILCGYLAPRTPGWNLLHGYEPHDCQVEYARLSAHSSASNLEKYIKSCKGKKVMIHTPYPDAPKGIIMPGFQERIVLKT
ncbi:MAG: MBL fold metallo-hydrolase [Candidatus Thorarchaeota archaeon]